MDTSRIRVLERAVEILEIIKAESGGAGISLISRKTDIPKSTVFRILNTLTDLGYVRRETRTDQYALGYRLIELSFSAVGEWEVISLAMPYLEQLREEIKETAALAVRIGKFYTFVAQASCSQEYRVNPVLGERYYLHWAGTGKVILAYSPVEIREEILSLVPSHSATDRTIKSSEELLHQIEGIQKSGFAYSYSERIEGGASISAPILNVSGTAIAAVSLIGPEVRIRKLNHEQIGKQLNEIAGQLSRIYHNLGVNLENCIE